MKLGLAMYTVRNEFESDPLGTLDKLADIGCKAIELSNQKCDDFPESPCDVQVDSDAVVAKAKERGIDITGSLYASKHTNIESAGVDKFWSNFDLMKHLASYLKSIGGNHMTLGIDYYPDKEYVLRRCEVYNKIGEICKAEGLDFLYHNHYHEWQKFPDDDKSVYEIIRENTDPDYVGILFDTYWAYCGAQNYLARMRQFGARIKQLHVKDFPFEYMSKIDFWTRMDPNVMVLAEHYLDPVEPEYFIELGDGMMKIQDIVDIGNELGVTHLFIEQDYTKYPNVFDSVKRSYDNMSKMRDLDLN
jgi:sugar phosphate isomerase/epimerase